jgi:hypothetical protein
MEQLLVETATVVEPIVVPGCPTNVAGNRALRLRCSELPAFLNLGRIWRSMSTMTRNQQSLTQLWDPFSLTSPTELVQSLLLLTHRRELTLDFVEGPSKILSFDYKEEMPLLKNGLYSGVYVGIYGKFKREVILIEYVQFEFSYAKGDTVVDDSSSSSSSNENVWQDILSSVFNHPHQREGLARFQRIKEAVTLAKCNKVIFVLGKKATGDCHVPMNTVTFGALVSPIIDTLDNDNGSADHRPLPLSHVTDRGGNGRKQYSVVRSWNGWGTLAHGMFQDPVWASGTLVQVRDPEQRYASGDSNSRGVDSRMVAQEQFGFVWDGEWDGEQGTRGANASILTRMSEQDEFAWFA